MEIKNNCLLFNDSYKKIGLRLNDITHIEAQGDYVSIYCLNHKKRRYTILNTMKDAENILGAYNFIRCHRSYIVNAVHTKHLKKMQRMLVDKKIHIPVGRVYKKNLKIMDAKLSCPN